MEKDGLFVVAELFICTGTKVDGLEVQGQGSGGMEWKATILMIGGDHDLYL